MAWALSDGVSDTLTLTAVSAVSDHLEGKNDIDWSIVVIRGQSLSSLSAQSKPMDGCAAVADVWAHLVSATEEVSPDGTVTCDSLLLDSIGT